MIEKYKYLFDSLDKDEHVLTDRQRSVLMEIVARKYGRSTSDVLAMYNQQKFFISWKNEPPKDYETRAFNAWLRDEAFS